VRRNLAVSGASRGSPVGDGPVTRLVFLQQVSRHRSQACEHGGSVRVLGEDDWAAYRAVRLAALQESPQAFLATYAEETTKPESYWRGRMAPTDRLLAEADGAPIGIASVQTAEGGADTADLHDLWVTPEARNTGVSSRLVQAAGDQAVRDDCTKLMYWVSTENGRAIAFASNAGFRVTSGRRTASIGSAEFGDQEIAMVLSLVTDPARCPTRHLRVSRRSRGPSTERQSRPTDSSALPPHCRGRSSANRS
jgi:GNAT superfamily N-acetyltransferase